MLARCPTCRATFSTDRTGRQDCPACGKPLFVPEAPAQPSRPPPGPTSSAGQASWRAPEPLPSGEEPDGTPWEQEQSFAAWRATVLLALFDPGRLFSAARLDRPREQRSFALWTCSLFWILGQLLDRFLLGPQREQMLSLLHMLQADRPLPPALLKLLGGGNGNGAAETVLVALLSPAFVWLFLYANAWVTHGATLLLGQNRRGFPATFAATAYGLSPVVLFAIPGCGGLIGLVWIAVLTAIGLRRMHRISTAGALSVTLAPYLLFCCLACGLGLAAASSLLPLFTQGPV